MAVDIASVVRSKAQGRHSIQNYTRGRRRLRVALRSGELPSKVTAVVGKIRDTAYRSCTFCGWYCEHTDKASYYGCFLLHAFSTLQRQPARSTFVLDFVLRSKDKMSILHRGTLHGDILYGRTADAQSVPCQVFECCTSSFPSCVRCGSGQVPT